MRNIRFCLSVCLGLSVFLAACSAVPTDLPQIPNTGVQTQVAVGVQQTMAANQLETQVIETQQTVLTQNAPLPTNTAQPTDTPVPTFTPGPTNTPLPTATVTKTPSPTATSTPVICNWAGFVKDMTVADGAKFAPGSHFTKVWRLKNIGSCTWTTSYKLVFEDGRPLGGSTIALPKKVAPGETVDIALPLKAPADKGTYKGYWILTDANGKEFGIGESAKSPIWVQIQVSEKMTIYPYDFASRFWEAAWKIDDAKLYPSGTGYGNYVIFTDSFKMETGKLEDEPAIIVNVESGERVRGAYPGYLVKSGDRFVAEIGCVYGSENCRVKMTLTYKVDGVGDRIVLGEWVEKYDDKITKIDIGLDGLVGKTVIFILEMEAKSDSKTNQVFWFVPSIRQP